MVDLVGVVATPSPSKFNKINEFYRNSLLYVGGKMEKMRESPQEKNYRNSLSESLRDKAQVSQSHHLYFTIINSHLKTLYGERADWGKCLDAYYSNYKYRSVCHSGRRIGDITLLDREGIECMLQEEKQYFASIDELVKLHSKLLNIPQNTTLEYEYIYRIAKILGVLPEINESSLYRWIINRNDITSQEQSLLNKQITENMNTLSLIVRSLVNTFLEGFQFTFPVAGCVMTKTKSRYFYRGENAFYKSSKASIFRGGDDTSADIKPLIDRLRYYECFNLLNQFDAVKRWGYSEVNWLALAQHYGLKTQMIDITSNLKTALFFACCKRGDDNKYRPLEKSDFEYKNSRKHVAQLNGDSRYAILYRTPTEITDMQRAQESKDATYGLITPVGYQPFMRCSHQDAFTLLAKDDKYDLLADPMFDMYKIRLDEDLCNWIFEEMDRGNAVFPHDDVPDITQEIESINQQTVFTESVFMKFINSHILNEYVHRQILSKYGYSIKWKTNVIDAERFDKINLLYNVNIAMDKARITPVASPMLILPKDTPVRIQDGQYFID